MDTADVISAADAWELKELQTEFADAVKHVGTTPGLALSEQVQRRLFGLHQRTVRGEPPTDVPAGENQEQWKAWSETSGLSARAAMQEYIRLVTEHDPDFLLMDGGKSSVEQSTSELPPGIVEQLRAAGIRQAGFGVDKSSPGDIFSAVRDGKPLAVFLPQDRDALDDDGLTPLIHAVDAEQGAAVEELLNAGACADSADPQGQTPLHYAALLGSEAIVERLLAGGASPCLVDSDGASPADVARGEGHDAIADRLAEAVCAQSA